MKNSAIKTVICAALALSALPAAAIRYNFSQDGYSDGGKITGWFEGVDFDGNGVLDIVDPDAPEITDVFVSYSGGSVIGPFTHARANNDLVGVGLFFIGTTSISSITSGPDQYYPHESRYHFDAHSNYYFYDGIGLARGRIADLMTGAVAVSSSPINVAAVPEPETYAMLLAGLGVVGWSLRKRQACRV